MGYKSVLRSVNASVKKSARLSDQRSRQQNREAQKVYNQNLKELERKQKRLEKHEEKLNGIFEALDQEYARGKVDAKKFEELQARKKYIGIDLVVLGGAAGVTLAKRYLTGKIEKDEFDSIYKATMPAEYLTERDELNARFNKAIADARQFNSECNKSTGCQHCGFQPTFFKRLKKFENYQLCQQCKNQIESILFHKDFAGVYFSESAGRHSFVEMLQENPIFSVSIKSDWI